MSSYSTNLALTLIGTGEEAGTWGVTTNTNLGTLLEQAISGYVTQTVSDSGSPTVLTIPNGVSGTARNMYIELTGALTAARTVEVPANKKLYFIYNNTTGGYAVTVKVSGQTGVSVPNGYKFLLVSNGIDIAQAINNFSGGLVTTNYTIEQSGSNLIFKYGATQIASMDPKGIFSAGPIFVNSQTIDADYTVSATSNAGTFGPITISTGVTVTVDTGGTWTIV